MTALLKFGDLTVRRVGSIIIAGALAISVVACAPGSTDPEATGSPENPETVLPEPTRPAWAPETDPEAGEPLTSFRAGNIEVDVYQVGVVPAPRSSIGTDDAGNSALLAGDDAVVFNLVYTNRGAPVELETSLSGLSTLVRYSLAGQKQASGSLPIDQTVSDFLTDLGLNPLWYLREVAGDEPKLVFGTHERTSRAIIAKYRPDSDLRFVASITPPGVYVEAEVLQDQ